MARTKTISVGFQFHKDHDIRSEDLTRLKELLLSALKNAEGDSSFQQALTPRQKNLALDLLTSNEISR